MFKRFFYGAGLFMFSFLVFNACSSGDGSNSSRTAYNNSANSNGFTRTTLSPTPVPYLSMSEWDEQKADYLKKYKTMMKRVQLSDAPYIKGKLATVGQDSWYEVKYGFDNIINDLPSEMRANDPAEAETVINIVWNHIESGYYRPTNGKESEEFTALQSNCTLTIIDTTIPAVIGKKTFKGPPPPKEYYSQPSSQDVVKKMILEYIKNLPRR